APAHGRWSSPHRDDAGFPDDRSTARAAGWRDRRRRGGSWIEELRLLPGRASAVPTRRARETCGGRSSRVLTFSATSALTSAPFGAAFCLQREIRISLDDPLSELRASARAPERRTMNDTVPDRAAVWLRTSLERSRDAHELALHRVAADAHDRVAV